MASSHDCLSTLLECVRSAWEGTEDAASCASRFLASVAGGEQEEQLRRVLSFLEAVRGALVERLKGEEGSSGGEGLVEQASRKKARCDVEREQEDGRAEPEEVHSVIPGQADTAVATAPELANGAVHESMSRAVKGVLLDGDLLGCVWGYVLGGTGRQDMRVLGQLSVVCRKWREVSLCDAWWGAIEQDMLPLLWEEEAGKVGSSRGRVLQYARFLDGQKHPFRELGCEADLERSLEVHVEIFDRMDGLQMLSMRGPVSLEDDHHWVWMRMGIDSPSHSKGTAFSAASRDPFGRFARMEEYLEWCYKEEYSCGLCLRATLRDMRTGKMAVIMEGSNVSPVNVEKLGEGKVAVILRDIEDQGSLLGRLADQFEVCFEAVPVVDQVEDVSECDMLWRLDLTDSCFTFMLDERGDVSGRFKRGVQAALLI